MRAQCFALKHTSNTTSGYHDLFLYGDTLKPYAHVGLVSIGICSDYTTELMVSDKTSPHSRLYQAVKRKVRVCRSSLCDWRCSWVLIFQWLIGYFTVLFELREIRNSERKGGSLSDESTGMRKKSILSFPNVESANHAFHAGREYTAEHLIKDNRSPKWNRNEGPPECETGVSALSPQTSSTEVLLKWD
jgi:hypothetical protein